MKNISVGVVIPTLNAAAELPLLIPKLREARCAPEILIVDSSSTDATLEIAQRLSVATVSIERREFNHGLTRELGRKRLHTDIVVMISQDIIPVTPSFLDVLVQPIEDGIASVAYARQIPKRNAGFIEAFPRIYNYPATAQLRSIEDAPRYGVYTFFCSDSCAAYLTSALDEIGGFPETIVAEDYLAAAKILLTHGKISYVAGCVVEHSHKYGMLKEFRRSFDTGVYRKRNAWMEEVAGTADRRGVDFVKQFLAKALAARLIHLIPYIIMQSFCKYVGYRLGYAAGHRRARFFRHLSMHPHYWR